MSITEKVQQDMVAAMKAREEKRLGTIRLMKSALKSKEIDKREPLTEQEELAVLSTMIKQRKDSIEQFTNGGRPELAAIEAAEIEIIETYMPKAVGEAEITAAVKAVISEMGAPTMKDMGTVMKNSMAKLTAGGARVEGKMVSETVKRELAGK
jgi:uncharacterized protein YqeY